MADETKIEQTERTGKAVIKSKIISTAKYAGTSITLGTAITAIIIFVFPQLKEISEAISALIIFVVNLILAMTGIISDND